MTLPPLPRGMRRGLRLLLPVRLLAPTMMLLAGVTMPLAAAALDVRHDMGGSVAQRIARVEQLRSAGTEVRILGTCVSACTLYLGLPKACVAPGARLGFHGPTTPIEGLPLPRETFDQVSLQMARYYPGEIRSWFMAEARMKTGDYYTISGTQAIAMGARACEGRA